MTLYGWGVLVALGALALAWHWRPRQPYAPGAWIVLGFYGVLGAGCVWFGVCQNAAPLPAPLQIWKPTLLYGVLAGVMIYAPLRGWGYPAKAIVGAYFVFSDREWHWINLALAALCASLAIMNLIIGYAYTVDDLDGFRFSCMVNLLALLLLRAAFVWMDLLVRIGVRLAGGARARPMAPAASARSDAAARNPSP